jgi:hypothetical protein
MSLSEFGEKAAMKLEQQKVAFDILNETNPNKAMKTLSIEGYDSEKWSRGFWNDINAQVGRNEREFEIIQRRPSRPISESTEFKKYYGTDEDIFYRLELKAPGKERYWNNKLINELDAGKNIGEGFGFVELPLFKIDTKMGEININKLSSGTLQENISGTSQITLHQQIQIPMQLQLQQSLQLQQQQQVQLQLQEQEQIQIQVQKQGSLKLQKNILIETELDINIEQPPDIPPPDINIIIPGLPPLPPKKKKPTYDFDTEMLTMEDYKFRHRGFPVVTSDFFRKVNLRLPKVKI